MNLQDAKRLQSEILITEEAAEAVHVALLKMRPGDKLIIERHKFEAGKRLFTFTEQTYDA